MDPAIPNPTPSSRRLFIRLPRPLWIALAAAAVVLAGIGMRIGIPIYRQYAAIREIERGGGYVGTRAPALEWLPQWLQDWINDDGRRDVFGTVEEINVGAGFNDDGMAQIAVLTEVRYACLGRSPTELRVHLGPMTLFEPLDGKWSDPPQFSDVGLAALSRMKQLQDLDLNGTRITDAGLLHIAKLTELKSLKLPGTRVTDEGLRQLRGLRNLESLDLRTTNVSDSGLDELHGLSKLNALSVVGTKVTRAGVDRLQRALPAIRIDW